MLLDLKYSWVLPAEWGRALSNCNVSFFNVVLFCFNELNRLLVSFKNWTKHSASIVFPLGSTVILNLAGDVVKAINSIDFLGVNLGLGTWRRFCPFLSQALFWFLDFFRSQLIHSSSWTQYTSDIWPLRNFIKRLQHWIR